MSAGEFSNIIISSAAAAITRVPGFRESEIAPIFFNPSDFGTVAIWHPVSGDQKVIRGIFDAEYATTDPGTGTVINVAPMFTASTVETLNVARNDRFEFSGLFYRVKEIMPDGTGVTVFELSKDKAK